MAGKSRKKPGTKQTLEYVEEPKKLHVKPLKCANARQKEFVKMIQEKEITICSGIPGSGKTYVALAEALHLIEKGMFKHLVLVKSVTAISGEEVGFLPGDVQQKMDPYILSFTGNIKKLIGDKECERLFKEGVIQIQPLFAIRGINIDESIIFIDECQNITFDIFKSIITRIGKDSKYIICGDVDQIDLKNKNKSILDKLINIFKDDPLVGVVKFEEEDCIRNKIIPHILHKLNEIEENQINKKIKNKN